MPMQGRELGQLQDTHHALHMDLSDAISEAVCFCCPVKSHDSNAGRLKTGRKTEQHHGSPVRNVFFDSHNFIDSFKTLSWGQLSVLHGSVGTKSVCKETNVS